MKKINLLILDNFEPSFLHTGFRVVEFNWLLNTIPNSKLLTFSHDIFKFSDWQKQKIRGNVIWNPPDSSTKYKKERKSYYKAFPLVKNKLKYMKNKSYNANAAYMLFLYNAYFAAGFLEKNKIPFAFTLFPGGGLRLNHPFSDKMLKRVFSSPMFRGCFVPQKIIWDYLLDNKFTTPDKLYFRYGGGFFQMSKSDVLPKQWHKEDKPTFDIAFVAYKYVHQSRDKGFDLVLHSLQKLVRKYPFVHLHCVGTCNIDDFNEDFSDIIKNLHIYSSQESEFFPKFFAKMDMALGPSRVNVLDKGAFDGFPLMAEAGFSGVPLFVSDELKMNHNYKDKTDLVIIKPDVNDIVRKVSHYIENQQELHKIGENGAKKIQALFDINNQQQDRMFFLKKYLDI